MNIHEQLKCYTKTSDSSAAIKTGEVRSQGGYSNFFPHAYVGSGQASALHPKKYQEFQAPQKIFIILATPKSSPNSVPLS